MKIYHLGIGLKSKIMRNIFITNYTLYLKLNKIIKPFVYLKYDLNYNYYFFII